MAQNKFSEHRENVAEQILQAIEAGAAPWQKPWIPGVVGQAPYNPSTGKAYRGMNNWFLALQPYEDPRWLTYQQASEMDGQVRKGEKSTLVEFWKWTERIPIMENGQPVLDADGKRVMRDVRLERPKVFYGRVFNAEQIDGLERYIAPEPEFEPVKAAEAIIQGAGVKIRHDQQDRAYYHPAKDQIHMPDRASFKDGYGYYATALHEIGHATGHGSRLDREFGPFGSDKYGIEELRAELASFSLAQEIGIGHFPDRHAGYVENWMKAIRADRNVLFRAARDAEIIKEWVLSPDKRQQLEQAAKAKRQANQGLGGEQKAVNEMSNKTYISVPYSEKEAAKEAGAKWNRQAKSWYIPSGLDPSAFSQWAVKDISQEPTLSPAKEFGNFLKEQGLVLNSDPVMDGKWHNVAVEGNSGKKKSGSYRGFADGRPRGSAVNFKESNEAVNWVATGNEITPEQRVQLRAKAAQNRQERQARLEETRSKAAEKSQAIVAAAKKNAVVSEANPYLERKGVGSSPGYNVDKSKINPTYINKEGKEASFMFKGDRLLVVPIQNKEGQIVNVQMIDEEGTKLYQQGAQKTGAFAELSEGIKDPRMVVIAEGVATAASIQDSFADEGIKNVKVVAAFDAGNLKAVAEVAREQHPNAAITIASDLDKDRINRTGQTINGVGQRKAAEAAKAVNGDMVLPYGFDDKTVVNDFNDLAQSEGKSSIVSAFREQLGDKVMNSLKKNQTQRRSHSNSRSHEASAEMAM